MMCPLLFARTVIKTDTVSLKSLSWHRKGFKILHQDPGLDIISSNAIAKQPSMARDSQIFRIWKVSLEIYLPSGTVLSSKYPGSFELAVRLPRYCPKTTSSILIIFMLRSTFTFSLRMSSASRLTCAKRNHISYIVLRLIQRC